MQFWNFHGALKYTTQCQFLWYARSTCIHSNTIHVEATDQSLFSYHGSNQDTYCQCLFSYHDGDQ